LLAETGYIKQIHNLIQNISFKSWERMPRLNRNLLRAPHELGRVLMNEGNTSAAAKEFEAFIRLAPNMPSNRYISMTQKQA
jgi:hypothetical protein